MISQPLNGENYYTWSRSILTALNAKNEAWFVDGTFSMPTNRSYHMYISWFKCNNMVLSWIFNSLNKKIATSVIISILIVEEVWRNLKTRFTQGNGQVFFNLKMIMLFYLKISFLWMLTIQNWKLYVMNFVLWDLLQAVHAIQDTLVEL